MAFEGVPEKMNNPLDWCWRLSRKINEIMQGKTNNTGSVTLTASAGSTTVTLAKGLLGTGTVILFEPTTANAATEIGNSTMYVSAKSVANKQFTITHANNSQTDRTFNYVLIG